MKKRPDLEQLRHVSWVCATGNVVRAFQEVIDYALELEKQIASAKQLETDTDTLFAIVTRARDAALREAADYRAALERIDATTSDGFAECEARTVLARYPEPESET